MKISQTKWTKGAILICEKCGKRENAGDGEQFKNYATELRAELKGEILEKQKQSEVRPMTSSCLGPCPISKQAACWLPHEGPAEIIEFDFADKKLFKDWVLQKL